MENVQKEIPSSNRYEGCTPSANVFSPGSTFNPSSNGYDADAGLWPDPHGLGNDYKELKLMMRQKNLPETREYMYSRAFFGLYFTVGPA